jgi:hypothetical protein
LIQKSQVSWNILQNFRTSQETKSTRFHPIGTICPARLAFARPRVVNMTWNIWIGFRIKTPARASSSLA